MPNNIKKTGSSWKCLDEEFQREAKRKFSFGLWRFNLSKIRSFFSTNSLTVLLYFPVKLSSKVHSEGNSPFQVSPIPIFIKEKGKIMSWNLLLISNFWKNLYIETKTMKRGQWRNKWVHALLGIYSYTLKTKKGNLFNSIFTFSLSNKP